PSQTALSRYPNPPRCGPGRSRKYHRAGLHGYGSFLVNIHDITCSAAASQTEIVVADQVAEHWLCRTSSRPSRRIPWDAAFSRTAAGFARHSRISSRGAHTIDGLDLSNARALIQPSESLAVPIPSGAGQHAALFILFQTHLFEWRRPRIWIDQHQRGI